MADTTNVKTAMALKGLYSVNKETAKKGGIVFSAIFLGVFLLATAVTGYIAVQSNLNNKCKDTTFGVNIATNKASRIFMIVMIVASIMSILAAFAGIGMHF